MNSSAHNTTVTIIVGTDMLWDPDKTHPKMIAVIVLTWQDNG